MSSSAARGAFNIAMKVIGPVLTMFSAYEGIKWIGKRVTTDVNSAMMASLPVKILAGIILLFLLLKFLPISIQTDKSFSIVVVVLACAAGYFAMNGYKQVKHDVIKDKLSTVDHLFADGKISKHDIVKALGYNKKADADVVLALRKCIRRGKNDLFDAILSVSPIRALNAEKGVFYAAICYKNDHALKKLLSISRLKKDRRELYEYSFWGSKYETPLGIAILEQNIKAAKAIAAQLEKENVPINSLDKEGLKRLLNDGVPISSPSVSTNQ